MKEAVGGRPTKVQSPLGACADNPNTSACEELLRNLRNPQSSGWAGAWVSWPSVYAVAAEGAPDVAAAVDFARQHNLRLFVKGGMSRRMLKRGAERRCSP